MKKLFKNVMRGVVALSMFAIGGCVDNAIDSQPSAAANIQTDARESYEFTALSPMSVTFNVSANTPWRIESDSQWCTVTPSMSASSSLVEAITVNVEENSNYEARAAVVTIYGTEIEFVKEIAINQDANADLIVLTPSAPIPAGGGEVEITVHSNKAWEYIALTDILTDADVKSGDGTEEDVVITVTVPANPGLSREGQFMIRTAIDERTYTLTQDGMVLRTNFDVVELEWNEFEHVVPVEANIDWKAEVAEDAESWLAVETSSSALTLKVLAYNEFLSAKTAEVTISPVADIAGIEPIVITVSQDVCYTLHASAEVVDEGVKFPLSQAVTYFVSKFKYRHGCFTIEFADGIQSVKSRLMFDMVHYTGDANIGNYRLFVATDDVANAGATAANRTRVQGGASMACAPWQTIFWTSDDTKLTGDDCHQIQTIQYELKKNDAGSTIGRSYVKLTTGREVNVLQTISANDADDEMKRVMKFQLVNQVAGDADDYIIIKSIKFEPYEGFEPNE